MILKKNHTNKKPTVLIILDGFGYRTAKTDNAIALADTPNITAWFKKYPHAILQASGAAVGLPEGYIGNSEVGHLTIGAGRIVPQALTIINNAIHDRSFFTHPILVEKFKLLHETRQPLHIMGLLSDAGVHSHIDHLYAFLHAAKARGIHNIAVHSILDGRDVPPQSAAHYLEKLEHFLQELGIGIIGSVQGRYYAMDRDKHYKRTELSYRMMTEKQPTPFTHWRQALDHAYAQGQTDEFVLPTLLTLNATIEPGSGIVFFNLRPDRARQLTEAFVDQSFKRFQKKPLPLSFFITSTNYDSFVMTDVLYLQQRLKNCLKEVISMHEKSLFSIAETEKYAHVTYFFDGGRETILPNEIRVLIPSLPEKNYAHTPQMSAPLITETVLKSLKKVPKDFYLINYANADMVGHSGNLKATIRAIECLDNELKKLYDVVVQEMKGTLYITADHGKAEEMVDTGSHQPRTAHTSNPVPFIMITHESVAAPTELPLHQLADIAPFILEQMRIPVPEEMKKPAAVDKEY